MSDGNSSLDDFLSKYLERRYKVLFYTLLLTLISAPILSALKWPGTLLELFLGAGLLAAIMPVTSTKNRHYLLAGMVMVWVARPVAVWMVQPAVSGITLGVWTLIGLLAAAFALRFAMRATSVDAEHLYAALSAYLLAGIYFGLLYWLLEQMSHGTFTLNGIFTQASAIYFSFVTLATLGYGDIAPRGDIARGIAIVEGVGGQLFLAVLVARLVSLYSKPTDR
jgi:voltage-gated potassium channel